MIAIEAQPDDRATEPDRAYGGKSRTERASERREQLIDAALDLLDREGLRAVKVRRVCQEAHLNNRYFYESFAGVDELLDAVVFRVERQIIERFAAAAGGELAGRSGVELVRAAMAIMTGAFLDDPRLIRVLGFSGESAMRTRRDELVTRSAAAIRPFVDSDVVAYLLIGGWCDVLWAWHTGKIVGTREQLVDALTDVFRRIRKPA